MSKLVSPAVGGHGSSITVFPLLGLKKHIQIQFIDMNSYRLVIIIPHQGSGGYAEAAVVAEYYVILQTVTNVLVIQRFIESISLPIQYSVSPNEDVIGGVRSETESS